MPKTKVVGIMGPTGGGKARLAVAVARTCKAILLSCDSMKVYRGMDIGTAKPPPDMREGVDWRGLDLAWPWERFDANRFREVFDAVLAEAQRDQRPLVLSGGTMLYLKAATEGLDPGLPRDPALRAQLHADAQEQGNEALQARLRAVDPAAAEKIHVNDVRRLVRALEVHTLTGKPFSSFKGDFGRVREDLERTVFVVSRERADMDARIDARIDRMLAAGWLDECQGLLDAEKGISDEAGQALGYRELLAWLRAGRPGPLASVTEAIKTHTRRFARKQLTWLRRLPEPILLELAPGQASEDHVSSVLAAL
ncbi:tRNA (adenosine(37)-N6)-dimethylallyltransferase MiaA [Planctomycetota bacterium]|nr:tRNA (adenosine(37)-N6)-dimethylallyltransferase MiaA [Planctomycetota bacterium]